MEPFLHFHFCPACGHPGRPPELAAPFRCGRCGFTLYFSAAIAAAAFIQRPDGRLLLIRRAKEPGRGLLAPPGGFVDLGETAEIAVRREAREEVGLELHAVEFLCSFPNHYPYLGVTYPVLDLFFAAQAVDPDSARALDEAEAIAWRDPLQEVSAEDLAFPSTRAAFQVFRERWGRAQETRRTAE